MPVTSEELVAALADRRAEGEAIVETAELRAIRENIRLAQLLGWFDASADTPWLVNLNVALVDALTEIWSSEIDEADARARSNWLAALTGLRDWANSVVKPGLYHLGGDSIVLDHARFALAYSSVAASGRDAYERWLERELEWNWEEEPRLKAVLLNHLRGVIRSLDPDLIGADTNVPEGARLRIALRGLPPFLQSLLIDDDDFRKQAELDGGYVVHIGADAEFPRSMFLSAVAAIYAAPDSAVSLTDASGRAWSVTTDTLGEFWPIRLGSDDLKRQTRGILALLPTPETRLRAFDKLVAESGISPSVAADWREELAGAPLDPDRIELLDREISSWPGIVARATAAAMEQEEASISALVPSDQRYYDLLAGADAPTLNDYAASLGTQQANDAPWPFPLAQARAILLLASQSSLIEGRLDYLSAEEWVKLGDWVRSHGDLLARIGFIECSLGHAAANPDLEPILLDLISRIVALDPDDADGHLRFFTSIAMFVEGEVSMRGTLAQRRPFARRIATFAHAAMMARLAFSGVERSEFAEICTDMRGWRFMVQTLVDLRLDPRWRPEYFSPRQVKNDALGRILNRAGTITEKKLPRAIAKKILGKKDSVLEASTSASVFWPGPIEGALPAVQPIEAPAELLDLLSAEFAEEDLSIGGLSRLVNMEMVFRIPEALLDTIIARLRDVGPKVFAIFPDKLDQPYLVGLGYVAATHRRPELAIHVQRLARYRRNRGMTVSIADEFQLALSAAAAHEDVKDWRDFLGQWILEVAHFVKSTDQARQVEAWIEALFDIDSGLRATAGRGLAAIRLLLDK